MTRLADAILQGAQAVGKAPMLDPQFGGQMGYAPNLYEWVSNQKYVSRQLVPVLIEAPAGFLLLPEPQKWINALKSMLETHARSITGLTSGLSVAAAETPVSGGGEMHQDPTNVTRERSKPVTVINDLYGRPFQNLLEFWIRTFIMNPDSKVPEIVTMGGVAPTDLLADMYSATVLWYEPDPSFTSVEKAWLTTNMFPLSSGDKTGRRNLTEEGELLEMSIEWAGVTQEGGGVLSFADMVHKRINMVNANPYLRPAFVDDISADVLAGRQGYQQNAEELGAEALIPQG